MLKKSARLITAILMVISLSLTITPIYNTNAQNNNEGMEQYEETNYQLFNPSYTGDAAWLNDFVLEEDPAVAGKVILVKYIGSAANLSIPAKATIGTTEYDVSLCNSPEFFLNTSYTVVNNTTKSVTFAPDFDTSNVTKMRYMFCNCAALTSINISSFNTENVTDMNSMFSGCSSLTNLDLGNFNTANVTDMNRMFSECSSLTNLNLSSFNTENVTDMSYMFRGCEALTTLDVSNFNTANVTNMDAMFWSCSSLTTLDVSNFNTENVTEMWAMFYSCKALTNLNVTNFNTANVTDMGTLFRSCSSLTSLDLTNFNTANATDIRGMFRHCSSLSNLDLSNFDLTSLSDDLNHDSTFQDCTSLQTINIPLNLHNDIPLPGTFCREDNPDIIYTSLPTAQTSSFIIVRVNIPTTGVTVTPANQTINVGNTFTITPTVTPDNATDKSVIWTSSDDTIATVDDNGNVTALMEGTATITATTNDGGFTAICTVTVNSERVDVTGVSLSATAKTINAGENFYLTANVTPDNATEKSVTWTTSDDTIATVDDNGKVTATGDGTATITATTNDGGFTASCVITVIKREGRVTGVTVTPISKTATVGEIFFVTPYITPVDAEDKSVTWSSSNPSIAIVDSIGKVKALREGNVTITATTNDGGYKASCIVTVVNGASTANVYRLYNPFSGEHFFTANDGERVYLASNGWNDEGIAWTAPYSSNRPVYRVFNPYTGEHHYTMNDDERNYLLLTGWNDEGISWYSVNANTRGTPVYRLFNPYIKGIGAHHYTVNTSERDYLITLGWYYEGIGWYGL